MADLMAEAAIECGAGARSDYGSALNIASGYVSSIRKGG